MKHKNILLVVFFLSLFIFQQAQAGGTIPSVGKNPPQINLASSNSATLNQIIWVYVLELNGDGSVPTTGPTRCWVGDTAYGCAEFNDPRGYTDPQYPTIDSVQQNPIPIIVEQYYLPDVIAREMNVAQFAPDIEALKAQALAARTVANWKLNKMPFSMPDVGVIGINNSTTYRVFIPGAYNFFAPASARPVISAAITSTLGQYLSYNGNGGVIDAEFSNDVSGITATDGNVITD
jgi:hypothetical protein